MKVDFKIRALSEASFNSFLSMNGDELRRKSAAWIQVDAHPGFPCRVSLEDARVGERVLAIPFAHHDVDSPYRSSGPIFVRENAKQAVLEKNEIPPMLRHRMLSLRGYSAEAMMVEAEVVEGKELEEHIGKLFQNSAVQYIHIHNAKPGCFNCSVVRV